MNDIITPTDDPIGYQLDWRHRIAEAAEKMLPAMGRDPDLKACYQHLHQRPNPQFDRITAWRNTMTGQLLEAYLVTGSPVEAIAEELGLDAGDVRLYCKIFWAIRDTGDMPLKGVLMRLRASLPREPGDDDRLVRAALLGGLEGLRGQTGARDHGDLRAIVEQELTRRVVAGELKTGDLIRLRSHDLMLRKIELDSRDGQQQNQDATRLLLDLLGQTAPRMKPVDQTLDQLAEADTLLRARIDSQRLATGVGVIEAGGERRLDSLMKGER